FQETKRHSDHHREAKDTIETPGGLRLRGQALPPGQRLRKGVSSRTGQGRNGEKAYANKPNRIEAGGEMSRQRTQGFSGLFGAFDVRNSVPMEGQPGSQNNEVHYEIGKETPGGYVKRAGIDLSRGGALSQLDAV